MIEKKKFDEVSKKVIDEMRQVGYSHIEAKILVYMLNNEVGISRDIEHATGLRQPEASVGLQKLRKAGLLRKEDIKQLTGKGRPIHKYYLKKSKDDTRQEIIKFAEKRISSQQEHTDNLIRYFDQLLAK